MHKKEGARIRKRSIIKIIVVVLIIHIILILTKCTIVDEEEFYENVSYEIESNYTDLDNFSTIKCEERDYLWRYQWEGWNEEVDNKISPNFRLINLENKSGKFDVEFAFFDDSVHRFADYQGIEYDNVRKQLPWNTAAMHSPMLSYNLEPYGEVLITGEVEKEKSDGVYWVYADVVVPKLDDCFEVMIYDEIERNKTVVEYRMEKRKRNVTKKVRLWDLLGGW